jgi:hypothetical protein
MCDACGADVQSLEVANPRNYLYNNGKFGNLRAYLPPQENCPFFSAAGPEPC